MCCQSRVTQILLYNVTVQVYTWKHPAEARGGVRAVVEEPVLSAAEGMRPCTEGRLLRLRFASFDYGHKQRGLRSGDAPLRPRYAMLAFRHGLNGY